jgi:asparagine synthase (glutamine-hydrolysing)
VCGIAGILNNIDPDLKRAVLNRMGDSLSHRGPDGSRIYEDSNIGLVHTRLSIIDLSDNGSQPMFNEDKSIVLICNGEIYNYRELRKDLIAKGHKFSSDSDCEVILHMYEESPEDFSALLNRLTGMFAFAIWDLNKQKLFVARDRVGIKPLYYYRFDGGGLCFGSEVKAISASGIVNVNIDETSLFEYMLLGSVPGPNTIYKEIKALQPGYFIEAGDGNFRIAKYWDIQYKQGQFKNENEVLEEVGPLLSQVVKDHLVADVPVGTFLSAGVDSSLLTAYAAEHHSGIHSFTASFPGEPEDEGQIALATAKRLGIPNHFYQLEGNFFKDFAYHFQHIDQPFAITSALSLGRISKLARQNIKVVLSGDGADELFGGYHRHDPYWVPGFLKRIPQRYRADFVKLLAKISGRNSLKQLHVDINNSDEKKYVERIQVNSPSMVLPLLSPDIARHVDTNRYLEQVSSHFSALDGADELGRMLYVDVKTTLVDEMLTKCDRMTMRHGIEGRVPYLDHRLVELAFSIPSVYKRRDGTGKLILRKLLAGKLGDELAFRKKTGFNSPLRQWLKGDENTRAYAKSELATNLDGQLLNRIAIDGIISDFNNASADVVFYIICLNHFSKSENTYSHSKLSA